MPLRIIEYILVFHYIGISSEMQNEVSLRPLSF
jgi:hypothetical protein